MAVGDASGKENRRVWRSDLLITAASEMELVKVEVTIPPGTEWINTRQDRVLLAPVTPMHYVSHETLGAWCPNEGVGAGLGELP